MAGWGVFLQDDADETDPELKVFYVGISVGLVILAGLMSGLTLGLMSMDQVDLEVRLKIQPPGNTALQQTAPLHSSACGCR